MPTEPKRQIYNNRRKAMKLTLGRIHEIMMHMNIDGSEYFDISQTDEIEVRLSSKQDTDSEKR